MKLTSVRVAAAMALVMACIFTIGGLASSNPRAATVAGLGPLCVVVAIGLWQGQPLAAWAMLLLTVVGFGLLIVIERGRDLATWLGLITSTVFLVRAARDLRRFAKPERPGEQWARALLGLVLVQVSGSLMAVVWTLVHPGATIFDPASLVEVAVGIGLAFAIWRRQVWAAYVLVVLGVLQLAGAAAGGATGARVLGMAGLVAVYVFGAYQLRRLRRDATAPAPG